MIIDALDHIVQQLKAANNGGEAPQIEKCSIGNTVVGCVSPIANGVLVDQRRYVIIIRLDLYNCDHSRFSE